MCGFVHVDNKRGHMLISCFGHNVQLGFECVVGQKMSLLWAYWYFNVCVIVMCVPLAFQNWFDNLR